MTIPVLLCGAPEVGAKLKSENKLLRADFGDGYSQVCADGINYKRKVWDLTWPYMTQQEAEVLYNFFDVTCGGGTKGFFYTVPGTSQQIKYTCEVYDYTILQAGLYRMTATIKQSFNLDD